MPAGANTGTVSVEVVPDASGWAARLRAQVLPQATRLGEQFGQQFGNAAERAIRSPISSALTESARRARAEIPPQARALGQLFASNFAAGVGRALNVQVRVQTGSALADLTAIDRVAGRLDGRTITMTIDLRGDVAALAGLAQLNTMADRLDGRRINLRVSVNGAGAIGDLSRIGSASGGASGRILAMVASIGLIGPALGPVAAVAAAAFGAIAFGAATAATGVGVLFLALAPVISAFSALSQAQDKAGTTASQAASRTLALAGANDSLAAALRGQKSAQLDAAQSAERSARRVADAKRSEADTAISAAAAIARADRSVASAEDDLADAQKASLKAQEALTKARADYAKDQEDLSSRIANGILDERSAQLELARAKLELTKANADPRVSDLERQQAQLGVDQALQGLADQQRENKRLAEEKRKADEGGVEGSEKVKNAQEQLLEANKRAAESERALILAISERAEVQRKSAQDIVNAQRDVAEAQQDAANAARQSAESIVTSQQAVVSAQRGVKQAMLSTGTVGGGAAEKLRNQLAKLAPEGRAFLTFLIDDLKPELERLSRVGQKNLLPGLTDGLESLIEVGLEVEGVIAAFSSAMGDMAREAGKAMESPFWRDFLRFLAAEMPPVLRTMGETFGNLARTVAGLMIAFAPVNRAIGDGILNWSRKLATLANDTSPSSPIQRFVRFLMTDGPVVAAAVADLALAIGKVIVALAPLGVHVANAISSIANFIAALPPEVLQTIALAIGGIAGAMAAMNLAASILAVSPIAMVIGGLAAAAVTAYREFEPFRDAVDAVWASLKRAYTTIRDMIAPSLTKLGDAIRQNLAPALHEFIDAVTPLVTALIDKLAPAVGGLLLLKLWQLKVAINTVADALRVVARLINGDFSGASDAFQGMLAGMIREALELQHSITKPFEKFSPALARANGVIDSFAKKSRTLHDMLTGTTTASRDTKGAVDKMADSADDAAKKAEKLADAQEAAANKSRDLANAALAARDAEAGYEAALDAAAESVKANGRTLDVHTEKGRANRGALDAIAEGLNNNIQSMADNGASHDTLKKKQEEGRQQLIKVATQMGMNKTAAKEYADKVLAIPKESKTNFSTPGSSAASDAVKGLKKANDDAAAAAAGNAKAHKSMWEQIRDYAKAPIKFVINTVLNEGILGAWNRIAKWFGAPGGYRVNLPPGFATGGLLRGPGTGTSDDILARVSNGEYVVRAAAVRKLGTPFLDQVNQADRYDIVGDSATLGLRPRFADGGLVGRVQSWLRSVDPLPYVWGGVGPKGFDCSGLAGEVWARMTEHPSYRRYMTTLSDFGALGFRPGTGAFTIGVSPTHMAGNLGGLGFEAESSKTGIKIGDAASAPGSFPKQYYLAALGGSGEDAAKLGLSITDPIGSARRLLSRGLRGMDESTEYGRLIGSSPRKAVDAAIDYLTGLSRFADGGLVEYDSGGWLPQGISSVVNNTGRPEPVLTGPQWDALVKVKDGKGPTVTIANLNVDATSSFRNLDALSHADRIKFTRDIRDQLVKLEGGTR